MAITIASAKNAVNSVIRIFYLNNGL